MKAEHRKELHTNVLADRMKHLVETIKNPPSTTSVVMWVIGGLAVATVILWFWFSRPSEVSSQQWSKLEADSYNQPEDYFSENNEGRVLQDLADIARNHPKTVPGRTARFQKARYLLPIGLKNLASPFRSEAYRQLRETRDEYEKLAGECGDNPVLMQEAYLGAGKAEEALTGAPDENDATKYIGNVDKAKEFFRKARDLKPDSFLGMEAARHYDRLDKNSKEVVDFYVDLSKRSALPRTNPGFPPGMPGMPPGFPGH